jgi:tRNA dimethylallyltransferase
VTLGELDFIGVVGPTATGKTELAIRLAEELNGEVVNADSVQVYRYFDIGSGKPTESERTRAPHHLLDVRDAHDPMEASQFQAQATAVLQDIRARGRVPIVAGGTFLWMRALIYGLAEAPGADLAVRTRHQNVAEIDGREALHAALAQVDPVSAERLHPQDFVRVSRALEVFETSGVPLSRLQAEHGFHKPLYRVLLASIDHDRDAYELRLRERTAKLFEDGFIDEVSALVANGYGDTRAMLSIGYRQVKAALDAGRVDRPALELEVFQKTRVFARRQRTWLRDEEQLRLPPKSLEKLDADVIGRLRERLRRN